MGNGETTLCETPAPGVSAGTLLIRSTHSLISAGTERMLVDFGRANWLDKARQQPEKVRMVLDKIRTEGLLTTLDAVKSKLDQPLPLGYCHTGVVLEVGAGVRGFVVGDRVVSNGPHAEIVRVPQNLCARVPEGVEGEAAAFTVLAAIGLQGIRLAQPTLGEFVVVTGLGLIGLVTVQLLRAQGCHVLGIDFDEHKLALAQQFGARTCNPAKGEDPVAAGMAFSGGRGVDAVIITASTDSDEPVSQAARMARKRGRIVLVGVAGLALKRAEFYEKELSFQVSCSYGPGRYDVEYEQKGHDYPYGLVRWTEQRNFEAVLAMMASGSLNVAPLITHRYAFDDALAAYDTLVSERSALGIVMRYSAADDDVALRVRRVRLDTPEQSVVAGEPVLGVLGAGNYASRVLLPAFRAAGAKFAVVVSGGGVSAVHHGKKNGFELASTLESDALQDDRVNAVIIATRHDAHAAQTCRALEAGKHVFVEKPLAITHASLDEVETTWRRQSESGKSLLLMIGFNRRFAPLVQKMKAAVLAASGPKSFIYTVNAGAIPADHWTQDAAVGGGRIIGEVCHFVDLLRFLVGAPVLDWNLSSQGAACGQTGTGDTLTVSLRFAEGSIASIHYFANGGKAFPKERLEVFAGGGVLQLDNFLRLRAYSWPGVGSGRLWRQDKGQNACAKAFLDAIREGKAAPIPMPEIMEVSRLVIDMAAAQGAGR